MAKLQKTYKDIKITVISSERSLVSYFNHGGMQYKMKVKDVKIDSKHLQEAVDMAEFKIDGLLIK